MQDERDFMSSLNWLQMEKLEQARRLMNDPATQYALEQHRKVQQALDGLGIRQLLDEQHRWRELRNAISPLPSWMEQQQRRIFEALDLHKNHALGEIQNWRRNNPVFSTLNDVVTRRALLAMPDSLLSGIVEALPEIEEAAKEDDADRLSALIQRLYEWLTDRLKKLALGTLSYEGALSIRISVVTFIVSTVLSVGLTKYSLDEGTETEERLTKLMRQQEEKLVETINQLKPAEDHKTYFVVERSAELKASPFPNTVVIGKLYPNQKVSLVTEKGKWIEVEYFDYVTGLLKRGWVLKKYLRRIL